MMVKASIMIKLNLEYKNNTASIDFEIDSGSDRRVISPHWTAVEDNR